MYCELSTCLSFISLSIFSSSWGANGGQVLYFTYSCVPMLYVVEKGEERSGGERRRGKEIEEKEKDGEGRRGNEKRGKMGRGEERIESCFPNKLFSERAWACLTLLAHFKIILF